MNDAEKRAYRRGYARARSWPMHRPPHPPVPVLAEYMDAVRGVRDALDNFLATIEPDDAFALELGPMLDRLDRLDSATTKVGECIVGEVDARTGT